MPKKIISFSLEEDLVEFIDQVKKENKLSSRSAALERILITKKIEKDNIEDIVKRILKEKNNNDIVIKDVNNKKELDEVEMTALNAMDNIFKEMK